MVWQLAAWVEVSWLIASSLRKEAKQWLSTVKAQLSLQKQNIAQKHGNAKKISIWLWPSRGQKIMLVLRHSVSHKRAPWSSRLTALGLEWISRYPYYMCGDSYLRVYLASSPAGFLDALKLDLFRMSFLGGIPDFYRIIHGIQVPGCT